MLLVELDASKVDFSSVRSYSDVFLLSCFIKRGNDVLLVLRGYLDGSWARSVLFIDI